MKATKRQFINRCKALGVTCIDNGFGIAIDAPAGFIFAGFQTHSEMIYFNDGWTMPELYGELLYYMANGIEKCRDNECEICTDITQLHTTINNYIH